MYAKFFAIAALVSAAAAGAIPAQGNNVSQCNVGEMKCCNSVQNADDKSTTDAVSAIHGSGLLGGIGLNDVLNGLTGQVGLGCTPLSVIGLGSNSCSAQPTCCTGNNFNGLVVVGCTPINAGL